jgi:hypothetical protein
MCPESVNLVKKRKEEENEINIRQKAADKERRDCRLFKNAAAKIGN